jgi:hypothetical protein
MKEVNLGSEVYSQLLVSIRELQKKVTLLSDRKKLLAEEYIDSFEASRILRISRRTLERYRDSNRIRCYKTNRKVYYRLSDIEHFLLIESGQINEILGNS